MDVNFGKTSSDYGRHRAGFPDELFERLAHFGIGRQGQRLLDLGTGTGTLARGFARRDCRVMALDPAGAQLREARRLDAASKSKIRYLVARAEAVPLPDAGFDVVTAGQCWHWFDGRAVAAEARRLLAPNGTLVIAHFDWLPLPGNVVEATERLIESHNPAWHFGGGLGMYPRWTRELAAAGFVGIETFSFDLHVRYSHESWRGRIRASAGVGASLAPNHVAEFDQELTRLLETRREPDPLQIPHRVFAVLAHKPA